MKIILDKGEDLVLESVAKGIVWGILISFGIIVVVGAGILAHAWIK